jgi:hypothetical protein
VASELNDGKNVDDVIFDEKREEKTKRYITNVQQVKA